MRLIRTIISILIIMLFLPTQGQDLWNKAILTSSDDRALATAVSPNDGSVVLVGEVASSQAYLNPLRPYGGGTLDGYVAKYTPDGGLLWATHIGAEGRDACGDVVIDESGNIYVTGYYETIGGYVPADLAGDHQGAGSKDAFILKLDPNGAVLYFNTLGSTGRDHGLRLAIKWNKRVIESGWYDEMRLNINC